MPGSFDRRVMPEEVLELVRACQRRAPCHLGGGAALAALHLGHRLSGDIDLFCHDADELRALVRALPAAGAEAGLSVALVRDSGTFVRAAVRGAGRELARPLELDLVHEALPNLEPPPAVEGVVCESLVDLRASKLTCLLSRSEPRNLVDLLFLERAGYPPERDLALALRKDAGLDPGVLAWLLGQFPVAPLPLMLAPLDEAELRRFRDDLRERLRRVALGQAP